MAAASTARIPLFNGENYATWRPQMEGILHKGRLLKYVNGTEARPADGATQATWDDKDLDARSELLISMEPAQVALIKNFKRSKEVWDYLEETYDRKSTRQKVEEFRKLVNIRMDNSQTMDEYLREFSAIVMRLTELDAKLDDDLLVTLLIDSLPENYKEVQAAFDAAKDFPSMKVVRIRLMEIGDRKKEINGTAMRVKNFNYTKYNKNKNNRSDNQFRDDNHNNRIFRYNCRRCGKRGHKARDCWSNSTVHREEKVNQTGMLENGFVMQECLGAHDNINKIKLSKTWCLDSGATSHMCRWEDSFVSLSKGNCGYVNLANNQKVEVFGIGTVKITTIIDNRPKSINLYNTLFVPDIKESLISVGKATDNKCKIFFHGDQATIESQQGEKLLIANKNVGLYTVTELEGEQLNITVNVDAELLK